MSTSVKQCIRKEHFVLMFLCSYALMLLCTYILMHLQVSSTKDYVRNFKKKMQNEPNPKVRMQKTEYRMQNLKMRTSVYSVKDCVSIFTMNCLSCYKVIISGHQETKPIYWL